MCFELFHAVSEASGIGNPDKVEHFDVFKSVGHTSVEEARELIMAAVKIYLENVAVGGAVEEAAWFDEVIELPENESFTELWDRGVVFCSPRERLLLGVDVVHPEQVIVSNHVALRDKTLVLQLKDFSYVVQYHFDWVLEEALPDKVFQRGALTYKLGTASSNAKTYIRKQDRHG